MPASPPDSTDSPPPSETSSADGSLEPEAERSPGPAQGPGASSASGGVGSGRWGLNALLFLATLVSVFTVGREMSWSTQEPTMAVQLTRAAQFAAALLGILLAHEFGHYFAARLHKVDASLPYFIPFPAPPFGTMGAVIRMRSSIPTRRALLDIGAAGPLAGLALAIPIYAFGVRHCEIVSIGSLVSSPGDDGVNFGEPLLTKILDYFFAAPLAQGTDRLISPLEHAGWAGMFVTMINLIPVGQLDGGHVAFSLFGPRYNRIAPWVQRSMLVFFLVSVASLVARDVRGGFGLWHLGRHVNNSLFWFIWFEILGVLGTLSAPSGRGSDRLGWRTRVFATGSLALLAAVLRDRPPTLAWGGWFVGLALLIAMELRAGVLRNDSTLLDHPPTGAQPLGWGRAAVAAFTLAFFVLLFMPTPIAF